MKRSASLRRGLAPVLALALACSLTLPSSAFFWSKKTDAPYVEDFSKNGLTGSSITFDITDFTVGPTARPPLAASPSTACPTRARAPCASATSSCSPGPMWTPPPCPACGSRAPSRPPSPRHPSPSPPPFPLDRGSGRPR